jgi:hypothetical protein
MSKKGERDKRIGKEDQKSLSADDDDCDTSSNLWQSRAAKIRGPKESGQSA